jgi:Tol biopolymer transport system component
MTRRAATTAGLAILVALLVAANPASARRGEPVLVSQTGGIAGDDHSSHASISADGRYVAFESPADNLSPSDDNDVTNIFVRDLQDGTVTLVSQASGVPADRGSSRPSISADGRYVAFDSSADNLSGADNDTVQNVFRRDLVGGTTELVSRADGLAGAPGDSHSTAPSISADGRYVAFESGADNLSASDNDGVFDIFVRDLQAHTTTLVSAVVFFGAGDDDSFDPSISADGRYVAFDSSADNLSLLDRDNAPDVFVRDVPGLTMTLASQANGTGGDAQSSSGSISADGRYVAFSSLATNLSNANNDSVFDIFVRDLQAGTTTLVSQGSGVGGDGNSDRASISADGRYVAFASDADNLSTGDNNDFRNVFVRDVHANMTTLASHANGLPADNASFEASISADGRFVAFTSAANNVSGSDNDDFENVFRQDLVGTAPGCSDVAEAVAREVASIVSLPCADADGDPITRSIVRPPAHGTLGAIDQASGTVSYTPTPGFAGPDSFSFQGADASGASNIATASLIVAPAPPAQPAPPTRPAAFGARTLVTLRLATTRIPVRGPLAVVVANANRFAVSGTLSGSALQPRPLKLRARSFRAGARAARRITLTLPRPLRRLLARKGRLTLRLTARVKDPAGNRRTLTKTVRPRLKRAAR